MSCGSSFFPVFLLLYVLQFLLLLLRQGSLFLVGMKEGSIGTGTIRRKNRTIFLLQLTRLAKPSGITLARIEVSNDVQVFFAVNSCALNCLSVAECQTMQTANDNAKMLSKLSQKVDQLSQNVSNMQAAQVSSAKSKSMEGAKKATNSIPNSGLTKGVKSQA